MLWGVTEGTGRYWGTGMGTECTGGLLGGLDVTGRTGCTGRLLGGLGVTGGRDGDWTLWVHRWFLGALGVAGPGCTGAGGAGTGRYWCCPPPLPNRRSIEAACSRRPARFSRLAARPSAGRAWRHRHATGRACDFRCRVGCGGGGVVGKSSAHAQRRRAGERGGGPAAAMTNGEGRHGGAWGGGGYGCSGSPGAG